MADAYGEQRRLLEADILEGYGMTPEEFDRRLRDAGQDVRIDAGRARRYRRLAPAAALERGRER